MDRENKTGFIREHLLVYAVTDRAWTGKMSLYEQVEAALKGGATMLQFREKRLTPDTAEDFLEEARRLRRLTEHYNVPFIIDDCIELALKCGADGVHVGQDDMDAGLARKLLGPSRILGVTAKTVSQAQRAQEQGADYLGSGAIFGTTTKADARAMTMETLQSICRSVSIPVVAIGGISSANIGRLAGSGVSGAAVVSGIFAAEDIEAETRLLAARMKAVLRPL